jgi:protein gp37
MGQVTGISWCTHTFNPWVGCTRVSNGPKGACAHCYAAQLVDHRFGWAKFGGPGEGVGTRKRTSDANWRQPLKWNRDAAAAERAWFAPEGAPDGGLGQPFPYRPFVFCASLADVFDNAVDRQWRRDLFDLIRATPHLTWLLLTKRPQNIERLFGEAHLDLPDGGSGYDWPTNAAIGCTVVTQAEADRDIPILLSFKAAFKPAFAFVSMEPLMEHVHLSRVYDGGKRSQDYLTGQTGVMYPDGPDFDDGPALDWVITGGETDQGPDKARLSHPDWFRSLRDRCAAAGVPFHHKQNGEWAPCQSNDGEWPVDAPHFKRLRVDGDVGEDGWPMQRVGKKHAGRLIDGQLHDARPGVRL